ncbi:MAG TPA: POTRA domain-containing protein [Terriglobales bacterium]|nr:POTRA domain-containing protein [Terriglobales bacterium]
MPSRPPSPCAPASWAAQLWIMRWIILPIAVVVFAAAAFPQTKESTGKQPSYDGQRVGSVDLIANPRIDTNQYRNLIVQKPGEPYSSEKIQATTKALQDTQAFSKVDVKVRPDPEGLKVTFVLEPAYYIGMITFPGATKRFRYTRLLQVVGIQDQSTYQQDQMRAAQSALEKFFADNGYFLAKVQTEVHTDDQNQLTNVAFNVQLGKHARIGKVDIVGPPAAEDRRLERTVRSLRARFTGALLKSGKSYSPTRIKSAVALLKKELGKEKHPANTVKVNPPNYHPETNRADISIQVDTGPEVDIRVLGARLSWIPFLSARREKTLIPIYEEASIDPDLITEGERNLANYFQKKGYFDVKVTTTNQQQNGKVLLVYQVSKGRKHTVEDISFRGNHHISNGDLTALITVKKKNKLLPLLSHGSFSNKLLRASIKGIEALYKDNGFEQVKVTPDVVDREPKIYITFNVAEGDRTIVSSLKVTGNKKLPLAQLRPKKGFEQAEGKPFSPSRMSDDRNRLAAKYLDRGFLNSDVKTIVSRHPDDPHEVDVTYQITEDQQVRIAKVLNLGQQHTKLDLIHVSTDLKPQEPLSEGKLLAGETKLYDLGIFDWASVGPRRQITNQSQEETLVKVHESKRNAITYGFGFEISRRGGNIPTGTVAVPGLPTINTKGAKLFPSEKTFVSPRGSVEYTRKNMRGEGELGAISVLAARLDQRLLLTYMDPHFRRSSWQALTSLSGERTTENPLFEARLGDVSLQFQRYIDAKNTTQLQLRYDFNRTKLTKILVPELVLPSDRSVDLSYVSGTIIRDTRDKPLDAHHGVYDTIDLRIVPSAFGSTTNFTRLLTQAAYYKPVHSIIFANSIRLGLAVPFSNANVPTSQRFFAGGGTTLRGFPINEAGPVRYVPFCSPGQTTNCPQVPVPIGGNQLFIFNSEIRYPIPIMKNLGGVVFYDGGNVYRRVNFPDFINNYTNTVGIGLRYSTPIGPIRVDFGHNLNAARGISANQFFITLGQAF